MNRDELFKRTKQVLRPEIAQAQSFAIFGVGSGGARVAEEVVRFGVGRVFLIDRPGELLEEHNVIRHPLGCSAIGQLKVHAMRQRLLDINPFCDVQPIELDVTKSPRDVEKIVGQSTHVLVCTDNEPSKHVINQAAVAAQAPLIFAGVFDGGCGGEVGRVLPGEACYACIASYLQRHSHEEETVDSLDYTSASAPQRSTAALNIDIAQIALLQARVALLTMLRDHDPAQDIEGNYIIFGNRKVDGLFPRMLHTETWNIERNPDCLVCAGGGLRRVQSSRDTDAEATDLLAAAQISG